MGKSPEHAVAFGSLSTSSLLTPSAVKPTSDRKIPPEREPDARRRKGVRAEPSLLQLVLSILIALSYKRVAAALFSISMSCPESELQ